MINANSEADTSAIQTAAAVYFLTSCIFLFFITFCLFIALYPSEQDIFRWPEQRSFKNVENTMMVVVDKVMMYTDVYLYIYNGAAQGSGWIYVKKSNDNFFWMQVSAGEQHSISLI